MGTVVVKFHGIFGRPDAGLGILGPVVAIFIVSLRPMVRTPNINTNAIINSKCEKKKEKRLFMYVGCVIKAWVRGFVTNLAS